MGSTWSIESGSPDWISFNSPIENAVFNIDYKDVKSPHTLAVNEDESEVKIEIVTV